HGRGTVAGGRRGLGGGGGGAGHGGDGGAAGAGRRADVRARRVGDDLDGLGVGVGGDRAVGADLDGITRPGKGAGRDGDRSDHDIGAGGGGVEAAGRRDDRAGRARLASDEVHGEGERPRADLRVPHADDVGRNHDGSPI